MPVPRAGLPASRRGCPTTPHAALRPQGYRQASSACVTVRHGQTWRPRGGGLRDLGAGWLRLDRPLDWNHHARAAWVSPTSSPTAATLSGPSGTAFTDTDAQANSMKVTLTQVLDPAPPGPYESITNGDRLVAAKFSIVGVSGTFSSDANIDASLIGSDGQTYTSFGEPIVGCTNFNYGTYSVTAGATTVGCVAFEVPLAVKTAHIEWGGFLSGAPASWSVG